MAYPTGQFYEVNLDVKRISDVAKNSRGPRAAPPSWAQWTLGKLTKKLGIIQTAVGDLLGITRDKPVQNEWQLARNRYNRMVRMHTAATNPTRRPLVSAVIARLPTLTSIATVACIIRPPLP